MPVSVLQSREAHTCSQAHNWRRAVLLKSISNTQLAIFIVSLAEETFATHQRARVMVSRGYCCNNITCTGGIKMCLRLIVSIERVSSRLHSNMIGFGMHTEANRYTCIQTIAGIKIFGFGGID